MAGDDFLLDGFLNQTSGKVVFGAIEKAMVLSGISSQQNHKWSGNISPSGMSWDMCPVDYIYLQLPRGWRGEIKAESEYKKAFGTAYHLVLQEVVKYMKKGYVKTAEKANYPDNANIKAKLKKHKPAYEVYIWMEKYRLSGWIDLILRIGKKLAIGDIKTVNVAPEDWLDEQAKLPSIKQLTQVYLYVVAVTLLEYYKDKPEEIFFLFHNNWALGTKVDPRFEWHSDVREDLFQITIDLLEATLVQLNNSDNKVDKPECCDWKYCYKHGSADIKDVIDGNNKSDSML